MNWEGYYINLERAPERRAATEAQIKDLKLDSRYTRFNAVDGRQLTEHRGSPISRAEVAIYSSHLQILRKAAVSNKLVHVIEDDVLFSKYFAPFIQSLSSLAEPDFDIFVTDTGFSSQIERYRKFKNLMPPSGKDPGNVDIKILDIRNTYLWGMSSYIVTPKGARKFLILAEEEWNRGPRFPIDIVLQKLVKRRQLSILCTLPFVTWLKMENAQISSAERESDIQFVKSIRQLARYPFFVERDLEGFLKPFLQDLLADVTLGRAEPYDQKLKDTIKLAEFLLGECDGAGRDLSGASS